MTLGQLISRVTIQGNIRVKIFKSNGDTVKEISASTRNAEYLVELQPYYYTTVDFMYVDDGALTVETYIES